MSDDEEYEYAYSDNDEDSYVYSQESIAPAPVTRFHIPDGNFITLKHTQILPMMDELAVELSDLFKIDRDEAQVLLRYCKWNKETVIDRYYAENSTLLVDAGVRLANRDTVAENPLPDAEVMCRICCDNFTIENLFGLTCGHNFCRDCYGCYIGTHIGDGPACVNTCCPEHMCRLVLPWSAVQSLISSELFEKYVLYQTRNFIETCSAMRWCPSPGCTGVVAGRGVRSVTCTCSHMFCFQCGLDAHDPCSCEQVSEWNEKCSTESMNATWIMANTKKCPNCNARIEKNQGCMHMTCGKCRHGFCWTCLKTWAAKGHTWNHADCNKYSPDIVQAEAKANSSRMDLERFFDVTFLLLLVYVHYFERFHGHDIALKFAMKQRRKVGRVHSPSETNDRVSTWADQDFFRQAVEQVIACRRVLKFSYVFGFYLRDNTVEKQLFEHHQQILEKHTEELSGLTENACLPVDGKAQLTTSSDSPEAPIEEECKMVSSATQCVNLTRTTEKFMQSLLKELSDDRFSREEMKHASAVFTQSQDIDEDVEESAYQSRRRARARQIEINDNDNQPPLQPLQPLVAAAERDKGGPVDRQLGRRGRRQRREKNVPQPPPLP